MDSIVEKIIGLIKEVKRKDIDPKLLTWIEDRYGPWDDRDFISDDGDTYFKTDADYESEGGGISHKIVKLPSFSVLIKQLKATRDAANELVKGESVRDDEILRDISNELKKEFNRFRTHLRKEYPAFYAQLKGQLTEEELDEMSTTGGGAGAASFTGGTGMQYATPYAFKKVKKEKLPEGHTNAENKKLKKISKALKSSSKMHKDQAKQIDKITKENKNPGASLGPGPKASEDGVKDNAYVKQFKYSLVPKKIKGSGLEVKQLFEADDSDSFQQERINAFDRIEQEMNDIYKMLSNAKNETSLYYTENPGSFSVLKPTDLVLDYIKDIKDLLKGE